MQVHAGAEGAAAEAARHASQSVSALGAPTPKTLALTFDNIQLLDLARTQGYNMHMHVCMRMSQGRLEQSVHAAARRDSERGGGGGGGGGVRDGVRPGGYGGGCTSGGDLEVYELADASGCSLEELQRVVAAMTRAARGDPQGRCAI